MNQIDRKNRVMADAWNCKKFDVTADPEITIIYNVFVDLEIIKEY
jgi:hypothetical protein